MDQEQLMGILSEMLEEQKETANFQVSMKTTLKELGEKMSKLEEDLAKEKPDKTLPVLQSNHQVVTKEMEEIKTLIKNVPRPIKHETRILFFPEHQSREYLFTLFGMMALGIIVVLMFIVLRYSMENLWRH